MTSKNILLRALSTVFIPVFTLCACTEDDGPESGSGTEAAPGTGQYVFATTGKGSKGTY